MNGLDDCSQISQKAADHYPGQEPQSMAFGHGRAPQRRFGVVTVGESVGSASRGPGFDALRHVNIESLLSRYKAAEFVGM